MSRSNVVLPFLFAVSLIAYLWPFFFHSSHQASSQPSTPLSHPIPGLFSHLSSPLLKKEATLLSYCPANQQLAWITVGRPPLYYSGADNQYYFGTRYDAWVVLTPDFSYYNPPPPVSWYGQPLRSH
ncbi:hypothetical protein [Sulfobacillus thermosulfidooxidans]|uniref:hypothetical protein n=1 Tax=Sulfobacillus thermosulfidooxidans TaxID=28034 RepID=UPI0006B4B93D|nr:hypothetical protein [Sulfobacillus thermosulfidooxidans]